MLNHAIASVGGSRLSSRSFIDRYVFPDGQLHEVGRVISALDDAGLGFDDLDGIALGVGFKF